MDARLSYTSPQVHQAKESGLVNIPTKGVAIFLRQFRTLKTHFHLTLDSTLFLKLYIGFIPIITNLIFFFELLYFNKNSYLKYYLLEIIEKKQTPLLLQDIKNILYFIFPMIIKINNFFIFYFYMKSTKKILNMIKIDGKFINF